MTKKLFFTIISIFILAASCKKESPKPLSDSVIGKYEVSSGKHEYYNASGTKIYEDNGDAPVGTLYEFASDQVVITNTDFQSVTGFYIVFQKKNDPATYLTISAGQTYSDTYVLKANSSSGLELYKETAFATYTEGGTVKTSQKSVLNILLARK